MFKALRPIYFILFILLLVSCRDELDIKEMAKKLPASQNPYTPDWEPPMLSHSWYIVPAQEIQAEAINKPEETVVTPEIIIKRDTIQGIPVRSPKAIQMDEILPDIHERESDAEAFYAISYISTNRYVGVNFDNDIFNNTDYYYTNGIRIEYISSVFSSSPFSYPMLPYRKYSMNYHGMTVVQNMYTPTNPDVENVLEGDRPFAAYLYLGHFKNTLSSERRYRQYSELDLGLIGPGSLGGFVQNQIHDIEPVGWDNQIQNDLVLNYTAIVEKGLYNPGPFDLNVFAAGQIGTLYDNLGGGIRIRLGHMNPYFAMPGLAAKNSIEGAHALNWQYGIFAHAKAKLVIYDATLQGGMINHSSNYTIPASDIERFVLEASVGLFISYKQFGLRLEQFYTTPEFKDAFEFRWGHINLSYCF